MRLYAQLEQLFKVRFNSNEEIISSIKKLSESGKFDEPKKVAVLAIILDRLGKQEDEMLIQESLKAEDINKIGERVPESVITELVTSPDAPEQPEVTEPVQPSIVEEPKTDIPTEETTVSEFTSENITDPTTAS